MQEEMKELDNLELISNEAISEAESAECLRKYKTKGKPIVLARATLKRRITNNLKKLVEAKSNSRLTKTLYDELKLLIENNLEEIKEHDNSIIKLFETYHFFELNSTVVENEIDSQSDYAFNIKLTLDDLSSEFKNSVVNSHTENDGETCKNLLNFKQEVRAPPLQCGTFSGSEDKLSYRSFMTQFNNVIGCKNNLSDSAKLTYLKGYLRGYALKVIEYLSISDINFEVAVSQLNAEFLDVPYIIDETLKKICNLVCKYDPNYVETKVYLNEIRSLIYELKSFDLDFCVPGSSGCCLISHIIFDKLPIPVKRELTRKADSNYPDINQILSMYNDIIKTLLRTTSNFARNKSTPQVFEPNPSEVRPKFSAFKSEVKPNRPYNSGQVSFPFKENSLQNFKTDLKPISNLTNFKNKPCKLCTVVGHGLVKCPKYTTASSRIERCKVLNLCHQCSSPKHDIQSCPGNDNQLSFGCLSCQSRCHITALCSKSNPVHSNLCLNSSLEVDKPYILPTLTLKFARGCKSFDVRCLIDSGSQRSYLADNIIQNLNLNPKSLADVNFDIKTFIGNQNRTLKETVLEVHLRSDYKIEMPMLIDSKMSLGFEVAGLKYALKNIVDSGYKLADNHAFSNQKDSFIKLDGLIGTDLIQFFSKFELIRLMNGSAFQVLEGIVPVGNVQHFLYPHEIVPCESLPSNLDENLASNEVEVNLSTNYLNSDNLISLSTECEIDQYESTLVNFVLDPTCKYFDPLGLVLTDSEVEHGLEKLFSLESIGLSDLNQELCHFDKSEIAKFEKGIVLKDKSYYVSLPWYSDQIDLVPSNHKIALKVLDRVTENLKSKNLLQAYQEAFYKHLDNDIIEKIDVSPENYHKFIWIPHRPVIKMDPVVTTKIRPVLNCSLRVGDAPSLNDAAYTGVDLMANLSKLLLQFRCHNYVMLADVRMAFLMIKLKLEEDRNRFCFFLKENDKVVAYRYKTLVFGFTSSPFILNFVIKHHANQYPDDDCSKILKEKMYVDNLIVTHDSVDKLKELYTLSNERMAEGGFDLRSWSSNSLELKNLMINDERTADHGLSEEKVLGYMYNSTEDTMKVANFKLEAKADTKRKVLAQTSKIFDPLGMFLPITVRGKLLMRDLWKSDVQWDEKLPDDVSIRWSKLYSEFDQLNTFSFDRKSFSDGDQNSLFIFCDASKSCYGFCCYALSDAGSHLVFSKAKVAPMRYRTLPCLELLSLYLAMKCLNTILTSFENTKFLNINIFVDAQIVLSWILSEEPKIKDIFIRNRVKDILHERDVIYSDFGVKVNFNYVKSEENPADLITRGISIKDFHLKKQFWNCGPTWISHDRSNWPTYSLNCLSEISKAKVQTNVNLALDQTAVVLEPLLPCENFSNLHKLHRVTGYVLKFIFKCRKVDKDPNQEAKLYWLKQMQKESFSKEIHFLKETPSDKVIPPLVNQLNLFLDDGGILRTRGRISRTLLYDFNVLNPIMLAKRHHLTSLMIVDFHLRCQHLGIKTTLNYIWLQGYWIPKARQVVKTVLAKCVTCKKFNSFSFNYPKMTNMPKHQMNFVKPFQHVGCDYTGHLWVKDPNQGKCVKMYILLYTCLNIRAIHLDLIPDMSSQSFLLSFQRFSNLYGIPTHLYSDNAKSFILGGDLLAQSLASDIFSEHMRKNNIKHVKIPVYSAWVGSAWERLIRVVKNSMYKTIGKAKLDYFQMLTSLSNIKNIVNSRPLTYRSSGDDNLEVISPNSFLKIHGSTNEILRHTESDVLWDGDPYTQTDLSKTLEVQEDAIVHFKKLWQEDYLLSLREYSRNMYQADWINKIKVGDIVLIKIANKSRPFWLMGRVLEVIIGYDNKIRSVKLKRGDGLICQHSICHLYPLELSLTHSGCKNEDDTISEVADPNFNLDQHDNPEQLPVVPTAPTGRPVRKAAIIAGQLIKNNLSDLF